MDIVVEELTNESILTPPDWRDKQGVSKAPDEELLSNNSSKARDGAPRPDCSQKYYADGQGGLPIHDEPATGLPQPPKAPSHGISSNVDLAEEVLSPSAKSGGLRSFLEDGDEQEEARRGPAVVAGAVESATAAGTLKGERQSPGHQKARMAFASAHGDGFKEPPAGMPTLPRSISFGAQDDVGVKQF